MTGKSFSIGCIVGISFFIALYIVITFYIDPFFHYHKPYAGITYTLNSERYQNDGILKNFDYDAIMIGTSMTQNFRSSELDKLFDVSSVKTPYSGASYKEINDELGRALKNNKNIKYIFRCLDTDKILDSYKNMKDFDYPYYLYDNYLYNDVNYFLNKTVLFDYTIPAIISSFNNEKSTTFDDYSAWYSSHKYGKEQVLKSYDRVEKQKEIEFTDSIKEKVYKTITYNVTNLAKKYPNTDFYIFFPPYSIYYYDGQMRRGSLKARLSAVEYAISLMVEYDNIHVYSFLNEFDLVQDLKNYKDFLHYSEKVNSQMLIWMKEEHQLMTKENYLENMKMAYDFYMNFDYDSLDYN